MHIISHILKSVLYIHNGLLHVSANHVASSGGKIQWTKYTQKVKLPEYQKQSTYTGVGTLIVATIYLQLIQNRYMFRRFTVLHCSHQHCVQPVASVGYL